jgi:uncharacterized protein (TIGR03435 family)
MIRPTHAVVVAALLLLPVALSLATQSPSTSFEVASVKPYKDGAAAGGVITIGGGCRGVDSGTPGSGAAPAQATMIMVGPGGPRPDGPPGRLAGAPSTPVGRCVFTRMTLKMLINYAYRLTALGGSLDQLLTGGPNWVGTDTFDVEAKAEDPEHSTQDQLRQMLQNLLAERFQLKVHREKKEVGGFDLTIAKSGLKMKEAEADGGGPNSGGIVMSMGNPASGGMSTVNAPNSTVANIITFLSGRLGRAIQDKTGLTARYQFSLNWMPGENETRGPGGMIFQPAAPTAEAADPGVSLFTALQEQMGLRLESAKVTIDAMVIDSAQRPAEQ